MPRRRHTRVESVIESAKRPVRLFTRLHLCFRSVLSRFLLSSLVIRRISTFHPGSTLLEFYYHTILWLSHSVRNVRTSAARYDETANDFLACDFPTEEERIIILLSPVFLLLHLNLKTSYPIIALCNKKKKKNRNKDITKLSKKSKKYYHVHIHVYKIGSISIGITTGV